MNTRWLVLLGLLVLVGIGAVLLKPYLPNRDAPTTSSATDYSREDKTVVCFGRVDVESGVSSLTSLQPGRVVKVCVAENSDVESGTVLIRMDDELAKLRVEEADVARKIAREQLSLAQTHLERQDKLLAQQQAALQAAEHRRKAAELMLTRKRRFLDSKMINSDEVGAAEEEARALKALEAAEGARLAELKLNDPKRQIR